MEYRYRCTNRGCKWLREKLARGCPYETTNNNKGEYLKCPHCDMILKGPLAPSDIIVRPFDYYAAVEKVMARLEKPGISQPTKDYCKAVMESLDDYASNLKATFVEDIKKDPDLEVFVKASRANDVQKRCVDDALGQASATKAAGHPVGEKYDWEIPYIMNKASWPVSGGAVAWGDMCAFLGRAATAANTQYLLSTRLKGRADGHTILITKVDANLWISDKQEQNYTYDKCDCIAWARPGAVAASAIPLSKRKITTAGKFDGDWVKR